MPKGMPKPQTTATMKYEKKVGIMAKTYKLKRETVERFKDACDAAGVSQAAKITELMEGFVKAQEGAYG